MAWLGRGSRGPGKTVCRDCFAGHVDRGPRPTVCGYCGESFESVRVRDTWTRTCSKACARRIEFESGEHHWLATSWASPGRDPAKVEANWRRKRARKLAAKSEPYTTAEIAARDEYRCGLCRGTVNMELEHPDLWSPSVDHIVPISKGGDDTRANVQLAHLGCNIRKGNRVVAPEQLRLVG